MQKLQSIYDQLIEKEDLIIDDQVQKELQTDDITVHICDKESGQIKIYSKKRIPISDIIPILGDFGFKTISEITYKIECMGDIIFVTKLLLWSENLEKVIKNKVNIKDILLRVIKGDVETGKLLGLVYMENFTYKEILLSRAFGNYAGQIIPDFHKSSLEDCIMHYHGVFALFLRYIIIKFDPKLDEAKRNVTQIEEEIIEGFKKIENISDDRVLKFVYEILQALVRTNYFNDGDTISLKFDVSKLSHILKGVQPKYESFIYSNDFQGTHLRVSKVCRGGIRWSNRDDFRTEVKSLMTTQEAKNAVIVPKGAKGGFIITKKIDKISKDEFDNYYTRYINALLDVVDNQKDAKVIKNPNIISYDGDDPYFVVAADRGTSSMSDCANKIAKNRGFWLADAFASGSSNGYHHKKLGITAKGALKASARFFIEKGVNFYKEPISIVGIGSMSGDVFGNGMILSRYFKLVAAVSSDEIFIDPNPDLELSYKERLRLFSLKRGKWSLYDEKKISQGGGVFKKTSKSIPLTKQIQTLLNTKRASLNGEELIKELLKLKVDMLYFGGIGTYVKSSFQNNIELGDKENEFVRIDANELNAEVICEGANLALTMEARIEYALRGGKLNLDSIDNSAGVDTSDHEVNLKILLNSLVEKDIISQEEKNSILSEMSEDVVNSVLWTNYLQSLSISLDATRSQKNIDAFKKSLSVLEENLDIFKRRYFNIPKDINFFEVIDCDGKLARPIIATMTLYAKILLQDLLSASNLYEDSLYEQYLFRYFPKSLVLVYADEIRVHPLRKEIISMIIANFIINNFGATFIKDLDSLGREKFLLKIKAYLATNELYDADDIRYEVYANDYIIKAPKQYKILQKIEDEILYNVQWMLKNIKEAEIDFSSILEYKISIKDTLYSLSHKEDENIQRFLENLNFLKFSSKIIKIKQLSKADFKDVSTVFYALVQRFEIPLLLEAIENISAKNETQELLKVQIKEILEFSLMDLTSKLLKFKRDDEEILDALKSYFRQKEFNDRQWRERIDFIKTSEHVSMSDLSVCVNYLVLTKESY